MKKKIRKLECRRPKWATTHFQPWIRHCSGVATEGAKECMTGVPAHTIEGPARTRVCLGQPITTGLLRCSVATESFLSRQRWLILCHDRELYVRTGTGCWVYRHSLDVATKPSEWAVSQQACTQRERQSAQHVMEEFYRYREFSVATGLTMFSIAIEETLSRQASLRLLSQKNFPCHDRARKAPFRDKA